MAIHGFAMVMAGLNFTGSMSSAIGAGFIILCYLALPMRRHFRHVLILNLAAADFLNAVNNAASGSQILMHKRDLSPGPGCVLNGLVGQITVQATDCAIFVIAVVTVYTITQTSHSRLIQGEWEWPMIVLASASIWTLPFITGFIGLGKGLYSPVSGNWCWLRDHPKYLRYVLTHGWRFLFILLEIGLYLYLHFYLRRHFRRLAVPIVSAPSTSHDSQPVPLTPITFHSNLPDQQESKPDLVVHPRAEPPEGEYSQKPSNISDNPYVPPKEPSLPLGHIMGHRHREQPKSFTNPRQRAIQRVLLLNAYPLAYIILWLPGLANRLVEASGHKSRVTQVMQASTQFVGLANALTYGWNERIAKQLKAKYLKQY